MRRFVVPLALFALVLLLAGSALAAARKGPQAGQFGPAVCADGQSYDVVVSPSDGAHTGKVVGVNVDINSLQITVMDSATGEVLFQSKPNGTGNNPQAQLCTIDGGDITLVMWAIVTPR